MKRMRDCDSFFIISSIFRRTAFFKIKDSFGITIICKIGSTSNNFYYRLYLRAFFEFKAQQASLDYNQSWTFWEEWSEAVMCRSDHLEDSRHPWCPESPSSESNRLSIQSKSISSIIRLPRGYRKRWQDSSPFVSIEWALPFDEQQKQGPHGILSQKRIEDDLLWCAWVCGRGRTLLYSQLDVQNAQVSRAWIACHHCPSLWYEKKVWTRETHD